MNAFLAYGLTCLVTFILGYAIGQFSRHVEARERLADAARRVFGPPVENCRCRPRHSCESAGDLPTRLNASLADEGEKEMDLNVTLHLGQSKSIVLNPTGPDGAAVPLASVPTYTSSDPSIVGVEPAADGLSAKLTLLSVGDATVAIHADGDPDTSVDPLDQNVVISLQQEEANALNAKVVDTPSV